MNIIKFIDKVAHVNEMTNNDWSKAMDWYCSLTLEERVHLKEVIDEGFKAYRDALIKAAKEPSVFFTKLEDN